LLLVGWTTKALRLLLQIDPLPFFASPTWRITTLVPFSWVQKAYLGLHVLLKELF